jgi:tetratricopeptide (TPR) repeat protein
MSSWFAYVLCLVILTGPGFAATDTQQNLSILFPEPYVNLSDNMVLHLPLIESPQSTTISSGQASKDEYHNVTAKELKETLNMRIEPSNPLVHDESLLMVAKLSKPGDSTIQHICSIYSYLKDGSLPIKGWIYATDPRGLEYFNYANESVSIGSRSGCTGAGDCDDFAILMASLVESIGGTTRIIVAYNDSTGGGHAYTEVYLGNLSSQDCQVNDIIDWLKKKYDTNDIFTYNDTDTREVWLNLDWGSDEMGNTHPGGPFWQADQKIVITVGDMSKKTPLTMPAISTGKEELQILVIPLNITMNLTESNSAEVWYNKGVALGYLGKYTEAIGAYEKSIEINPQGEFAVFAWISKSVVLDYLGRYDEAIQACDKALQIGPQGELAAIAWGSRGFALYSQKNYAEAASAYHQALKLNSSNPTYWNIKGNALYAQDEYAEAVSAYDQALKLDSSDPTYYNNKGNALYAQDKYAETVEVFDQALKLNSSDPTCWNLKGLALYAQDKYAEAVSAYDQALKLNSSDPTYWKLKGLALYAQDKYAEAVSAYDQALKLNSSDPTYWNLKGLALYAQNKYAEAVSAYDQALELNSSNPIYWNNKGLALDNLGKHDEAVVAYDQALELNYSNHGKTRA